MKDLVHTCKVALIQAEPVMFDKRASLEKVLKYIDAAMQQQPDLIVFPELFIPGYPIGMNFGFSMGKRTAAGREDWKKYYDASVVAGDMEFQALAEAARKSGTYVSLGFSERDAVSGTLYNSNVIFEPDGTYKIHRKLKPTGAERTVWGDANKDYFPVTEIYISPNTNDNPEWQATIQHIAIEGKCYFINADMIVRKSSYPSNLNESETISQQPEMVCRGGSCIVDPYGHYVTEPVWDQESIIYAELDMSLPAACKMEHDAVGHYARPDVLELIVNER